MSAPATQTTPTTPATTETTPEAKGFVYDEFAKTLDPKIAESLKGHFDETTKGLKSALDSEREARTGLEKQIKELASKAEKGSELESKLNELSGTLTESNQRAAFYEAASAAGCVNLKLAYLAAKDGGLFLQNGQVNMDAVKAAHPQLFQQAPTGAGGGAGAGTGGGGGNQSPNSTFNNALRAAAGVRRS